MNIGNKVYNRKKAQRFGGENIEASVAGFWTPENNTSTIPGASNAIPRPSDYFVESGNFFRINNISVGYSIETRWSKKLRFYVSMQNPIMLQKYSGYTSELPRGVLDSGIELDIYPGATTYLTGVNINL